MIVPEVTLCVWQDITIQEMSDWLQCPALTLLSSWPVFSQFTLCVPSVALSWHGTALSQVLEFLSNPTDESRHEERQQALMELIHAGGLAQFDETRLLRLAENAKL